jgi:polyisoprenoid-binding protein YceI
MKTLSQRVMAPLLLIIASTALSVGTAPARADAWLLDLDQGSGAVTFDAIGKPSALKIHAKGNAPKGQLKVKDGKVSGVATLKLDSLDTGIKMRNEHMKKRYLETDKHPEAKLTLTELPIPAGYAAPDFSASDVPFKGTLSLHGVEKPIEGKAKLSRSGGDLSIDARFSLKIDDFAIKSPSFAGITMASDVNCAVEAKAPFKAL